MWRGYLFLPLWWLIFALLVEFWLISFLLSFFCVASAGCVAIRSLLSFWGLGGILPRNSRILEFLNLEFLNLEFLI